MRFKPHLGKLTKIFLRNVRQVNIIYWNHITTFTWSALRANLRKLLEVICCQSKLKMPLCGFGWQVLHACKKT